MNYRKAVHANGEVSNIYCALDRDNWRMIEKEIMFIADRSRGYQIDGVVIDMEQYRGQLNGQSETYGNNTCFCDHCFGGFARSHGFSQAAEDVAPSERYAWLLKNGLLEEYYAYLQREIVRLYSRTVKKVHDINPSFVFAFCLWTNENWYFDALPRAFGTGKAPVLVLDEGTYYTGYFTRTRESDRCGRRPDETYAAFQTRCIKRLGGNALYIPGFYVCQFFDYELGAHIYSLARDSGGYWIYHADMILSPRPSSTERIHGPKSRYLEEIKHVNEQLDGVKEWYPSPPRRSFDMFAIYDLVEESNNLKTASRWDWSGEVTMSTSGECVFFVRGGELEVRLRTFGSPLEAILVDNSTFLRGHLQLGSDDAGEIHVSDKELGPMVLLVNSTGRFRATFKDSLAGIRLPAGIWSSSRYYFRIPANCTSVSLICLEENSTATIRLAVRGSVWEVDLRGRDQETVSLPRGPASIGKLEIEVLRGSPILLVWVDGHTPVLFPERSFLD